MLVRRVWMPTPAEAATGAGISRHDENMLLHLQTPWTSGRAGGLARGSATAQKTSDRYDLPLGSVTRRAMLRPRAPASKEAFTAS